MRCTLTKKNSTKAERIFAEILKELRIPFQHRVLVEGREADFLLGNICVEIDGHSQDWEKNKLWLEKGYIPVHFTNEEIKNTKDLKDYVNKSYRQKR